MKSRAALLAGVVVLAVAPACKEEEEKPKVCKAFDQPTVKLELEFSSLLPASTVARISNGFALAADGKLYALKPIGTTLAADLGANVRDVVVAKGAARAFVLRGATNLEVVRYEGRDATTFDAPAVLFTIDGAGPTGGAIDVADDGTIWIATPDADPSAAQDGASRLGKVLKVTGDSNVEIWARGFKSPVTIDFDDATGDLWVADKGQDTELDRVLQGKSYGWPIRDGNKCVTPGCLIGDHVDPTFAKGGQGFVHRGTIAPFAGQYVFADGELVSVSPYGPTGPASEVRRALKSTVVGSGADGEVLVASGAEISKVIDRGNTPPPKSLLETGCFDPSVSDGTPKNAAAYDIASPLWSDGATKARAVVVPDGEKAKVGSDGDMRFPVGTGAIKTFIVDGKKGETRLLIQHRIDNWVGYSYAWKDDGSDAELVSGSLVKPIANGKTWYYPSTTDCTACHTATAGFTLGLDARQIPNTEAIDQKLDAPINRAEFPLFAGPDAAGATAEAKARAYLHSNCAGCHRPGSFAGGADLDLRAETPLANTGLCAPPQLSTLGLVAPSIIAPGAPEKSILPLRMRALDETRMPKLATRVVDDVGVAAVEAWIRELTSCP